LQRADGDELLGPARLGTPVGAALTAVGFGPTPRGLRLRGQA
jgi:ATP-dependent Lhr-like helicase